MIEIEQFYFQILVGFFTALAGIIIYKIIKIDIVKIITISVVLVVLVPILPFTVISPEITFKERTDFLNSYITNTINMLPSILAGDIGGFLASRIENETLSNVIIIGLIIGIILILGLTMINSQLNIEPETSQENINDQINTNMKSTIVEQFPKEVILVKKLVCYDTISPKINKIMKSDPKIIYNCQLMSNETGFTNLTCPNEKTLNFQMNTAYSFHTLNANFIQLEDDFMIQYKIKGISKSCIDESK